MVGVDKIRASVNVDYDQDTTDETQEKYDPTVSAVLSEQKSEDQMVRGRSLCRRCSGNRQQRARQSGQDRFPRAIAGTDFDDRERAVRGQ